MREGFEMDLYTHLDIKSVKFGPAQQNLITNEIEMVPKTAAKKIDTLKNRSYKSFIKYSKDPNWSGVTLIYLS